MLRRLSEKIAIYRKAIKLARKNVKNWSQLLFLALFRRKGVFHLRSGRTVSTKARLLLKMLMRSQLYQGFYKMYDVDVKGEKVLDVGAFVGDSVIYWLEKGAAHVIAVEPVPLHFEVLLSITDGLPVTAFNAAVGCKVPDLTEEVGSGSYAVKRSGKEAKMLDIPVLSLISLVKEFRPDVVKIDCEGCEYYVEDDVKALKDFGVKKILMEIHSREDGEHEKLAHNLTSVLGVGRVTANKPGGTKVYIWEINDM